VDSQHPATLINNISYGPFGVTSDSLGNGINESFGYAPRGALTAYTAGSAYSFSLGLTSDYNITSANDSVNGYWSYGYDQFNLLASASKTGVNLTWVYDRFGNRWQQNGPGGPSPQYTIDTNNHINGSGVAYDALGNVLNDGVGHSFTYDAENRVTNANGTAYVYDAFGRRVKNGAYEFLYDLAGNGVALLDAGNGGWAYGEIYAGGRHLVTYSGGTTNFLHTDWLGTKRAMSSVSGTQSMTCTGLPFGESSSCATSWNFNSFTDDFHDSESNTEHTLYRQLSTTQGRWLSPDPYSGSMDLMNPQSLNRYAYVNNNPMNATDPSGLDMCLAGGLCDNSFAGLNPALGNSGWVLVDGVPQPSSVGDLILANGWGTPGPANAGWGHSQPGKYGGSFSLIFTAGAGGWTWTNNLNGAELSPAAASEEGLFADNGGLPAQLPIGTPQRFWNPFTQALNEAEKRVQKKRCSAFYAGQGLATLKATQYRFLDLGTTAGGSTNHPGFSVFLNSNPNGPFMNPPRSFLGINGPLGIRAFILLHELGHELSNITGFVEDAGANRLNTNLRQSQRVVDNCF